MIMKIFFERYEMRKILVLFLLSEHTVRAFAQQKAVAFNQVIEVSITYLTRKLPPGSRVATLNFSAPTDDLSNAAGLVAWNVLGFSYDDELAAIPGAIDIGVTG
jgi:hypothetical protein